MIHERGRPTEKWDLTMIIFVEHVRKLTIKLLSLFNFWSCDTSSSSSFKGRNTLMVVFLTIDVPIEVSRICLNVADQVIYIQIALLPNVILNFSSQSFKFWPEFLTARLFCFSMSFVSSANLPSYFRGDPGNRRDRPTSFGWDVFIRRILKKEVIKLKFSCTERVFG